MKTNEIAIARPPMIGPSVNLKSGGLCSSHDSSVATQRRNDVWGLLMKRVLACAAAVGLTLACSLTAYAQEGDFKVTLLGTGTPTPDVERFGAATFVEVGNQRLLFDVGRGSTIRLWQLGAPLTMDAVFLTHLHSDHVVGIPDLLLTGWIPGPWGRTLPFTIVGPEGTRQLMTGIQSAFGPEIAVRLAAGGDRPTDQIAVQEVLTEGVVYDRDGVIVTAFTVDHDLTPAFGYRIDYDGRSVVISGDTRYNDNVVRYSTGADLLINEVAGARPEILAVEQVGALMANHTSPQEAGMVFSRARPVLAVYSHILLIAGGPVPPLTPQELVAQTRETYDGPVQVGADLMTFEIRQEEVRVERP